VVEDTDATVSQVQERFGDLVARCVALLTDAPGDTRKARKAKTYAALAQVSGDEELALVVKAADRLANVRACVADGDRAALADLPGRAGDLSLGGISCGAMRPAVGGARHALLLPERTPA
jgi:hypothetical protein